MRVLLALDGSAASRIAVEEVARRPWPPGSRVRVVSVAVVGMAVSELAVMAVADLVSAESRASGLIDEATGALAGAGIACEGAILHGAPHLEIVEEARRWDADLVVLGTHGRRGMHRLLEGSVAEYVVRHAPCSVEVARPSPHEDPWEGT